METTVIIGKRESYLYDGLYTYWLETWNGVETGSISCGTGYDGPPDAWRAAVITTDAQVLGDANVYKRHMSIERGIEAEVRRQELVGDIIERGRMVRVVSGRKVAIGTVGRVFWIEDGGYGKVGIALDDTKDARGRNANVAWTYLRNLAVIDPDQYKRSEAEIRADYPGHDEWMEGLAARRAPQRDPEWDLYEAERLGDLGAAARSAALADLDDAQNEFFSVSADDLLEALRGG